MKMVMRPVRPVVKIRQPPVFGKGENWKALNFRWREASGRENVIALATGANVTDVESVKFWWAKRQEVAKFATYCEATGQGLGEFRVFSLDRKTHMGAGTFPAGATADDVAHFFTALRKRGLDGMVWPDTYKESDDTLNLPMEYSGLLFHFRNSGLQMPGFGQRGIELRMTHFDSGEAKTLRIEPHEKLPPHFAGLFYGKRAQYQHVVAAHRPQTFMVYSIKERSANPTEIYELGRDRRYHTIGEIPDGDDGGGFIAEAHGVFSRTPTASNLAWIACKLAARQRWLVLVKRADEDLDPDTVLLMSAFAPHEFENAVSEISIWSLTIGSATVT